jgi:ABC-type branched-subunit amino acid transport system substrate-binding protein
LILLVAVLVACTIMPLTRPVLKIGLVGPFQGPYRYVGYDALYSARLALREVNAAGGAGGYLVQLAAYDDQGTAEGARTAARNLAIDDQVVAVVGHYRDEATVAAREIYVEANLPLVIAGTVEGKLEEQNDWLCSLLNYLADASQDAHRGHEAMCHVQWIAAQEQEADAVFGACSEGLLLTVDARIPPVQSVDAVLLTLDPLAAGETVAALRETGWDGAVVGGPALGSPLFTQVADTANVLFASPYRWPYDDGRDADFIAAYRSLGPHTPQPGPFAVTTYQAVHTVLSAMNDASSHGEEATRRTLAKNLPAPSPPDIYVYRWVSPGTPELVKRLTAGSTE